VLQDLGKHVSTKEVMRGKVPVGAHDDVVGVVLTRPFENFMHDKADESNKFHFDPAGLQRICEAFPKAA
jgi:hypothetical protein